MYTQATYCSLGSGRKLVLLSDVRFFFSLTQTRVFVVNYNSTLVPSTKENVPRSGRAVSIKLSPCRLVLKNLQHKTFFKCCLCEVFSFTSFYQPPGCIFFSTQWMSLKAKIFTKWFIPFCSKPYFFPEHYSYTLACLLCWFIHSSRTGWMYIKAVSNCMVCFNGSGFTVCCCHNDKSAFQARGVP